MTSFTTLFKQIRIFIMNLLLSLGTISLEKKLQKLSQENNYNFCINEIMNHILDNMCFDDNNVPYKLQYIQCIYQLC